MSDKNFERCFLGSLFYGGTVEILGENKRPNGYFDRYCVQIVCRSGEILQVHGYERDGVSHPMDVAAAAQHIAYSLTHR
jgi:hypothetical protein